MFDLAIDSDVARIRINRPEARNAIPLEGWPQLQAAADEAERRDARLLVISGEPGGAFCAGADISSFGGFRDDAAARTRFRQAIRSALDRLRDVPIPTIALVEGACYGAGVALAMACDIRIASGGARFAITPAKLGISYPQEDVHRLVSLVGPGQAARLLFGAQSIDGAEAARIGLAELHCDMGADEALAQLSAALLANDRDSLCTLKRSIGLAAQGVLQDDRQDRDFDDLLGADAVAERLAAHRNRPR